MNTKTKLQNSQGRFMSLTVQRAKNGLTSYCAQIRKVTPKTLSFVDRSSGRNGKIVTVPLENVVSIG